MRGRARRSMLVLGLLLGCGLSPTEVTPPADGTSGSSTSTSIGTAPTASTSTAEQPTADGSGGATGQGTAASSDGGTTQGVQPDTSTGELASTGGASSTGVVDPSTSTGGEPSSTGSSPSCDDLYDMAPDYLLCLETEDECHFNATTGGGNCNEMCGMFGGTCIDAIDNSDGCNVNPRDTDTCDTDRTTEVCVCSR